MKSNWESRFFSRNKEVEAELVGTAFHIAIRAIERLDWRLDDNFWAPDLQVSRYIKNEKELFLIQETYFGPKLTGEQTDIDAVKVAVTNIDPQEELYAGK